MKELSVSKYRRFCKPSIMGCKTTKDLEPNDDIIGQDRALRALSFGLEIREKGFNVYAAGAPGTGKSTTVSAFLKDLAEGRDPPSDWCYVYNFVNPSEPNAIELPSGMAEKFKKELGVLIDTARQIIPEVFESEDYITRRQATTQQVEAERKALFEEVSKKAEKKGFILRGTQAGLLVIPVVEGVPLTEEQIGTLSPEMIDQINKARSEIDADLRKAMRQLRKLESDVNERLDQLNKDMALYAIGDMISDMRDLYKGIDEATKHIDDVEHSILENLGTFIEAKNPESAEAAAVIDQFFTRYQVNVMVSDGKTQGAPVMVELNPTYSNLFGRIEKEVRFGVLTTDFTLIKPGSLHKANGGYLMIPVIELAKSPGSYESLKRALKNEAIEIEDMLLPGGPISAKSLKPEPIPLRVKVILLGDTMTYQLLYSQDPDFKELFKVKAHFDTEMDWTDDNVRKYAGAMANVCGREGLKHLDVKAAAKVIEFSSRLADDQEKLSTQFADVADIIREATFYASQEDTPHVSAEHVKKAIEEKIYRSNLIQQRLREYITRGVIRIETEGSQVGQVNGLSVMQYGDFSFGGPSRVTASVAVGRQGLVDIERESNLGGSIHTKGVMIIAGYLSKIFAQDKPLSLTARLVFEQSYSGVDGDSASSTELYALLSVLSGIPIKQNFAVTGSVDQNGQVQAIGGVNEKIEGFFEVCKARGLTGEQAVIIPISNVQNLMLKEEIVEAAKEGLFHIYPVSTIEEGIEILTGVKAGKRKEDGSFEKGTIFQLVDARLSEMASKIKEYSLTGGN
ncbi:MAG: Lon protease family protein [Candidatus Thorarchaeota archaeon]